MFAIIFMCYFCNRPRCCRFSFSPLLLCLAMLSFSFIFYICIIMQLEFRRISLRSKGMWKFWLKLLLQLPLSLSLLPHFIKYKYECGIFPTSLHFDTEHAYFNVDFYESLSFRILLCIEKRNHKISI